MRLDIAKILRCPECAGPLELTAYQQGDGLVEEGALSCAACADWYRIEQGIADLLPLSLRRQDRQQAFAERHGLPLRESRGEKSSQKADQVEFFIHSSTTYEDEITKSPYFMALDAIVFDPWVRGSVVAGGKILEIGCGSGRQSLPMAQAGADVLGVDISEEMLRVARAKAAREGQLRTANFIVADAENLPLPSESFDGLVMVGALHHMESPERVFGSAAKALRQGGRFFIYDPHDSPLRFLFDWLMKVCTLYEEEAGDDFLFREEQMRGYFAKLGLTGQVQISTYLPPHLFYLFGQGFNRALLRASDALCGAIPGFRKCGGMIISTGTKNQAAKA